MCGHLVVTDCAYCGGTHQSKKDESGRGLFYCSVQSVVYVYNFDTGQIETTEVVAKGSSEIPNLL